MNASLNIVHQLLLDKGIAFARYSLPETKACTTFISYHPQSFQDLNTLANIEEEGFVFAPFIANKDFPIWYLKSDKNLDEQSDNQLFVDYLRTLPDIEKHSHFIPESTHKSEYSEQFECYLNALNSGKLDKAILSKIVTKPRTKDSLLVLFSRLVEKYPAAFNYLIYLPSGETWMGATPELLVRQDNRGIQTMALAGTQQLKNRKLNEIVWEQKEIEEQAYVKNYVFKLLNSVSNKVNVSETYTVDAGNLAHLRTDFSVNQNFSRDELLEIVKKLHPTPAVCGIPLKDSKALILQTEKHHRAYYTGYLGPVNKNSMSLFVNLRCMKIEQEKFALFVGGGITRDSELEKEWNETEAKAQTLLSVLTF